MRRAPVGPALGGAVALAVVMSVGRFAYSGAILLIRPAQEAHVDVTVSG